MFWAADEFCSSERFWRGSPFAIRLFSSAAFERARRRADSASAAPERVSRISALSSVWLFSARRCRHLGIQPIMHHYRSSVLILRRCPTGQPSPAPPRCTALSARYARDMASASLESSEMQRGWLKIAEGYDRLAAAAEAATSAGDVERCAKPRSR
jgi:hypothetical protein